MTPTAGESHQNRAAQRPPLRVRTGRSYPYDLTVDLGQRNAVLTRGPVTPLQGYVGWGASFTILSGRGVDLFHTHNAIPLVKTKPFVVTFESFLPRLPDDRRPPPLLGAVLRRRLLADDRLAIVAQSQYALRRFKRQNRGYKRFDELLAKTRVIYPGIRLGAARPKPARRDVLRLVFVGRHFMRKGGPALLLAHQRLHAAGIPTETTVVVTGLVRERLRRPTLGVVRRRGHRPAAQ